MLRKILFWAHLTFGVVAGLAIAIMCLTAAALAFEKDWIAWAERDARTVPSGDLTQPRLSLEALLQRSYTARPDLRINSVAIPRDPHTAIALGLPGNSLLHVNPHTGELREGHAPKVRAFLRTMMAWHIRLNFAPGPENLGRQLNSAANLILVLLCLTGLVLWWPRRWSARAVRPSLWFVREARGRARDWNWHNVIGFWTLPVLLVLAVSGVVLSYRWAGNAVFHLAGETPPAPSSAPARPTTPVAPPPRASSPPPLLVAEGAAPTLTAIVAGIQARYPTWELLTVRFSPALQRPSFSKAPLTVTVRMSDLPPFAATTLTIDANTGALVRTEAFADLSAGQRARRWLRFLHTGEAFRAPGQLAAGVASLGGVVLVWTGFALAWRRWRGRRHDASGSAGGPTVSST